MKLNVAIVILLTLCHLPLFARDYPEGVAYRLPEYSEYPPQMLNQTDSAGLKTGVWIETCDYYIRLANYSGGKPEGTVVYYDRNFTISFIEEYRNGKLIQCSSYNLGELLGQTINIGPIKDFDPPEWSIEWLFQGYEIGYYENGAINYEGWSISGESYMIDYLNVGIWKYYDRNCRLSEIRDNGTDGTTCYNTVTDIGAITDFNIPPTDVNYIYQGYFVGENRVDRYKTAEGWLIFGDDFQNDTCKVGVWKYYDDQGKFSHTHDYGLKK